MRGAICQPRSTRRVWRGTTLWQMFGKICDTLLRVREAVNQKFGPSGAIQVVVQAGGAGVVGDGGEDHGDGDALVRTQDRCGAVLAAGAIHQDDGAGGGAEGYDFGRAW